MKNTKVAQRKIQTKKIAEKIGFLEIDAFNKEISKISKKLHGALNQSLKEIGSVHRVGQTSKQLVSRQEMSNKAHELAKKLCQVDDIEFKKRLTSISKNLYPYLNRWLKELGSSLHAPTKKKKKKHSQKVRVPKKTHKKIKSMAWSCYKMLNLKDLPARLKLVSLLKNCKVDTNFYVGGQVQTRSTLKKEINLLSDDQYQIFNSELSCLIKKDKEQELLEEKLILYIKSKIDKEIPVEHRSFYGFDILELVRWDEEAFSIKILICGTKKLIDFEGTWEELGNALFEMMDDSFKEMINLKPPKWAIPYLDCIQKHIKTSGIITACSNKNDDKDIIPWLDDSLLEIDIRKIGETYLYGYGPEHLDLLLKFFKNKELASLMVRSFTEIQAPDCEHPLREIRGFLANREIIVQISQKELKKAYSYDHTTGEPLELETGAFYVGPEEPELIFQCPEPYDPCYCGSANKFGSKLKFKFCCKKKDN